MEYLSYWQEYCCISRGYFLRQHDKRKLSILTKNWQLWNLWRNCRSILVNVRSKIVLVSQNIIFNQCFRFWKQRFLFASKKQMFEQLKQEHILQITLLGWYSMLKAISLGKKAMKLCQVKQRLEYCSMNWRQWLQQRPIKINQGKRILENWKFEKIQKITAGSSSSTNPSSSELAGKASRNASLIHIDYCQKWSVLFEHQMHGILKRIMIAWSLTKHNAQLKN